MGQVTLHWSILGDTIVGELSFPSLGWVGIGWGEDIFVESTAVTDWVVGTLVVEDCWKSDSVSAPVLDTSLGGITNVEGSVFIDEPGRKVLRFSRPLSTGDVYDVAISTNANMRVSVAYSDSLDVSEVRRETSLAARAVVVTKSYTLNFGTGVLLPYDNKYVVAHAVLMGVAFGILFVLGIAIGRYVPRRYALWFYLHVCCSVLGVAVVIAGFAVAVSMVARANAPQWNLATPSKGAHAVLGVIALVWVLLQGILGAVTKVHWDREFCRSATLPQPTVFPYKVHWVSGYILPVIGFVNVFLGLYDWGVHRGWMGLWGGYCALVISAFVALEIRKHRKDKAIQHNVAKYYDKGVRLSSLTKLPRRESKNAKPVLTAVPEVSHTNAPIVELVDSRSFSATISPAPARATVIADLVTSSEDTDDLTPSQSMPVLHVASITEASLESTNSAAKTRLAAVLADEALREDELAKETDGELVSTEDSTVNTPRSGHGSGGLQELAELEAVAAQTRRELVKMEEAMNRFE